MSPRPSLMIYCIQAAEECLAGTAGTTEQSTVKWRVPFRMRKTAKHFEVRLGPPGGDKVRQCSNQVIICTGQLCRDTRRSLGRTLPSSICVGGSTTSSCPSSQSTGERRTSSRSREEIVKPWGPRTIIHFTSPATLMAAMAENLA